MRDKPVKLLSMPRFIRNPYLTALLRKHRKWELEEQDA